MSKKWLTRHTLLQRASDKNDHQAWDEFVVYYKRFIDTLISKMRFSNSDNDDLSQEIILNLWKNLSSYNKDKASFRTWMSSVVKNTILNFYRGVERENKRRVFAHDQEVFTGTIEERTLSDLENVIEREWKSYISGLAMNKIEKLFSGNAVEVFKLSLQGVSTDEISTKLNLKQESVYVLKNRVKSRFMEEIRILVKELEY